MTKGQEQKLIRRCRQLERETAEIVKHHPEADPHDVWHTLLALEETPEERLRLSLTRGQALKHILV